MEQLLGKTETELIAFAAAQGQKPFRGKQLYSAIYSRRVVDISQITEFSKELRERLALDAQVTATTIADVFYSEDEPPVPAAT